MTRQPRLIRQAHWIPSGSFEFRERLRTRASWPTTLVEKGRAALSIQQAIQRNYKVKAKYFASDVNRASARTKVYATITRNWGRPDEEVETTVVTLETGKDMHDLVTLTVR